MSPLHSPTRILLAGLILGACAGRAPAQKAPVAEPLMTAALAGAPVIVPPLTMVIVEPGVAAGLLPADRLGLLAWADSVVAELMVERAPEVRWVLPPELRRVARRSPGVLADPDQMGQAVMRQASLRTVPDPLRGYLRNMMAVAGGGRYAFIPAAIIVSPASEPGMLTARVAAVLADGRSGAVLWRTEAAASGATPGAALAAAFALIFPVL